MDPSVLISALPSRSSTYRFSVSIPPELTVMTRASGVDFCSTGSSISVSANVPNELVANEFSYPSAECDNFECSTPALLINTWTGVLDSLKC